MGGARLIGVAVLVAITVPRLAWAGERCEQSLGCRKLLAAAQKYLSLRQYKEAQVELERALTLSGDGQLLKRLAEALLAQQRSEDALQRYEEFLRQLPASDPDREQLAHEYRDLLAKTEAESAAVSDASAPSLSGAHLALSPSTPPPPCAPSKEKRVLRIAGATLLGLGAAGLLSGIILWSQNGKENGRTDCGYDGRTTDCKWRTETAAVIAFSSAGAGLAIGSVMLGLSFRKERSVACTP
jgi:tetratricopeptide (TPR) repeat protein